MKTINNINAKVKFRRSICSDCEYRMQSIMASKNLSRFDKVCNWAEQHEKAVMFIFYIFTLILLAIMPRVR